MAIGAPASHSWTDLSTTAFAGDTQLVVDGILDWQKDDEIVLTPTDFDPHEVKF